MNKSFHPINSDMASKHQLKANQLNLWHSIVSATLQLRPDYKNKVSRLKTMLPMSPASFILTQNYSIIRMELVMACAQRADIRQQTDPELMIDLY